MKCNICNENEAVMSLRQVMNNKISEIHLCMDCATKFANIDAEVSNPEELQSHFSPGKVKELFFLANRKLEEKKNRTCPVCGVKYQQLMTDGKAGCPECYSVFAEDIHLYLKKRNADGNYMGTLPNNLPGFRSTLTDRAKLQQLMELAIANEEYEKAALYRDQLKLLDSNPIDGAEQ